MKSILVIVAVVLVSTAYAQFEGGFVKILEDQRYQDGANFGNFRNQEDGIKYKEETNAQGVRVGFWEYPDETGKIQRVEFEAGPGIGFRITNSNIVAPTPIVEKTPTVTQPRIVQQPQQIPRVQAHPQPIPRVQTQPQPIQRVQTQPQPQIQQLPQPHVQQLPQQQQFVPIPVAKQPNNLVIAQQQQRPVNVEPEPINIFDYAADLQFFRDASGHRFKFTAV